MHVSGSPGLMLAPAVISAPMRAWKTRHLFTCLAVRSLREAGRYPTSESWPKACAVVLCCVAATVEMDRCDAHPVSPSHRRVFLRRVRR